MSTDKTVTLEALGITPEDLDMASEDVNVSLDNTTAVWLVLRQAVLSLRASARSHLLKELGISFTDTEEKVDLARITPEQVSRSLFAAFLSEAFLTMLEDLAESRNKGNGQ